MTACGSAKLLIPDTGRHGTARLDAVTALAKAFGCQARSRDVLTGHRDRAAGGGYYLTIWGPPRAVAWLQEELPAVVAALDAAATAATRGYAAWLHHGCGPADHMPAQRPTLRASWRRAYLRAYGAALAARIAGYRLVPDDAAGPGELYRGHRAAAAAERDAAGADLAPFTPRSPRPAAVRAMRVPRR
jgi:hypothetical protein